MYTAQYRASSGGCKLQASDIAAARAVPIVGVVGAAIELKRDYGLCPFHAERSPSFHVDRRRNRYKCFGCGAGGDTIEFVRRIRNIGFAEAVGFLAGGAADCSLPHTRQRLGSPVRDNADAAARTGLARALWESADHPRLAQLYLYTRGITGAVPDAVRGHRAVWCAESRRKRPAVLAAVTDGSGAVLAVQRIWVETSLEYDGVTAHPKGCRSLDLSAGKKTLGPCGDGAVRLAPAASMMGIAEGVETALSAQKLFRIPTWATLGTARLGSVTLPDVVSRLVIFGDAGEAGHAAAEKASKEYGRRGYTVMTEYPDAGYADFNDQMIGRSR
jgi:hypothetical protein